MIRWGVTAARWMAEDVETAKKGASASKKSLRSPDLYPASPIFTAPGGWWSSQRPDRHVNRFPRTPEEARAAVRAAGDLGSPEVKIMCDAMGGGRVPLPPPSRVPGDLCAPL